MSDLSQAEKVFRERREKAIELYHGGDNVGVEDIAVAIYGRSDGMTIAAVRDLLRERS